MTNYSVSSVDEYIKASPEIAWPHLNILRELMLSAVENIDEGIHYGKPYYKYHGYVAGFDVYKRHIGFELWTDQLSAEDREVLEDMGYKTGSRTFQIRYDQAVPIDIIKRLVQEQARVNVARTK